jgi:hypothetical protein
MVAWTRFGSAQTLVAVASCAFLAGSGCALRGTWRAVETTPEPAADASVLSAITFDSDGRYTASELSHGTMVSTTGDFSWNGKRLELRPMGSGIRSYPCKKRWGGKMVLEYPGWPETYVVTLRREK